MQDSDVSGERYVVGYRCPVCGTAENDVPYIWRNGQVAGWVLRIVESALHSLRCATCGTQVPRDHWRFESRPNLEDPR